MAEKTNKNRKYGRSRSRCESYRKRGMRERNKKRKLLRHLRKFPRDKLATKALEVLNG